MTIAHISSDSYFTPAESSSISRSVTAVAGDVIYVTIRWRRANAGIPINLDSLTWNSQPLVKYGTTLDDGEARTETRWVQASASATANLTGTLSDSQHYVIVTNVGRPPGDTTVSAAGIQEEIYNSGTYSDPSLTVLGVPSGALTVSMLGYMGWDTGYGTLLGTLSCDSPFTPGDGDTNTNYRGVWALFVARDDASTGSVSPHWSRSVPALDEPQYIHRAFYFTSATVATIDSVTTDGNPGLIVGQPFLINTTGLGTLTSVTIKTAATPTAITTALSLSAVGGDGGATMAFWVDTQYYPFIGSVVVTASDGTNTAELAVTLSLPDEYASTTFNSVVTSNNTYIGYWLDLLGKPLLNGDFGYYDNVVPDNYILIRPDSGVEVISAQTVTLWVHRAANGIIEGYTVNINDAGEITGLTTTKRIWIGIGVGI